MNCHPQTPQSPSQLSAGPSDSCLSMPGSKNAFPTPAHSVNGGNSQQEATMDDSILKRKRSIDDAGDQMAKRLYTDAGVVGIEALHQDVGKKYRIRKTPVPVPAYQASDDFFSMFNLEKLSMDLAREKPSGEKNILRKSFKNQLKRLNIDGGYDTKKDQVDDNNPESLLSVIRMPDDVWYANFIKEKDVSSGLPPVAFGALNKACAMSRGKIRKEAWDSYVLGSFESGVGAVYEATPGSTAPNTPGGLARQRGPGSAFGGQVNDPSRPRRSLKKRNYLDSAYEDGHVDDDMADGGYSTGDADDRSGLKRRKKVSIFDLVLYSSLTRHRHLETCRTLATCASKLTVPPMAFNCLAWVL